LLALPDEKLMGKRLFDGLADTAMILTDVAKDRIPAELLQFTKDMESMKSFLSDGTLWTVKHCLERLEKSAGR
jgi:cyclic beta-1,2-glucan synthetase